MQTATIIYDDEGPVVLVLDFIKVVYGIEHFVKGPLIVAKSSLRIIPGTLEYMVTH